MLVLHGTVPIFFTGTQYNIPVEIYITEDYPRSPPQIYVRPTPSECPSAVAVNTTINLIFTLLSDMIIKPNHKQVDTQGLVYLPYLHGWNPSSSSLVDMVTALCQVFGEDPPVYAKSKQTAPAHADSMGMRVVQGTIVHDGGAGAGQAARGVTQHQYQPQHLQPTHQPTSYSVYHPSPSPAPVQSIVTSMHIPSHLKETSTASGGAAGMGVDPAHRARATRERLVGEVTSRLQECILLAQTRLKDEMEKEFKAQQELGRAQVSVV